MKTNFLKLQDVSKVYDNGYTALKDFNLSVKKGEFVTFLGPSGCGKTTTLRMIAGFEMPTTGKILIDNVDIKDLAINKRPTATVFQDYALFPNLTVMENVSYGLKMMRKPLRGIDKKEKQKVHHAYNDAVKRAAKEIKKIEKQQRDVLKDIAKTEKLYAKYPEALAIKNMRYQQYVAKIDSYLTQMDKKHGSSSSKLNRKKIFKKKLPIFSTTIFNSKRPSNYNHKGLNEYEIKILDLKK
ncbi:MAG: ABC transporter ATP-binding protein [Mycoplasmoidaceae bacterium]|nr:ABC transporter ATP-binding protein [Mycoplasmoidaceae bacterium]